MNMKRIVQLTFEVDWENYDDVSTELLIEDVFENYVNKDGVKLINVLEIK